MWHASHVACIMLPCLHSPWQHWNIFDDSFAKLQVLDRAFAHSALLMFLATKSAQSKFATFICNICNVFGIWSIFQNIARKCKIAREHCHVTQFLEMFFVASPYRVLGHHAPQHVKVLVRCFFLLCFRKQNYSKSCADRSKFRCLAKGQQYPVQVRPNG